MSTNNFEKTFRNSLPEPIPPLIDLHRIREPGCETHHYIGLDRNERLTPFPDWFLDEIRQSLGSILLNRYPVQDELQQQLVTALRIQEDHLLLTPGSDAAIKAIYHAYIRPGDTVLMLDPSYAMYPVYAEMFQAKVVKISFDRNLSMDEQSLLESIKPGVRLVMLANPNQPTSTLLSEEVVFELLARAAEIRALVAIDEAYYPFSQTTALPFLKTFKNLLILRTFSKSAGMAGLRIGYVMGHPEIISNLFKVHSANDVNSFAILCATKLLSHPQIIDDYVADVKKGRRLLTQRARELGLIPLPSHTNFMLIRVAHRFEPKKLVEHARQRGYLVKGPFSTTCLEGCIRVSIGPPELMARFVDCMEEFLEIIDNSVHLEV